MNRFSPRRFLIGASALLAGWAAWAGASLHAADVKLVDPTSVVMIVNRDSNEIAFMDIKTHKIGGKTFLGNNGKPDRAKCLSDIKGVILPQIANAGRSHYATDTELGATAKIDRREDKVLKLIRVRTAPRRIYMSDDGKYAITPNNGDQTISIID